ncbi:hypothetical protein [Pseudomonas sp. dw_358]|nr:hypothetical protein [Pseudomonas sp. dw_358]
MNTTLALMQIGFALQPGHRSRACQGIERRPDNAVLLFSTTHVEARP